MQNCPIVLKMFTICGLSFSEWSKEFLLPTDMVTPQYLSTSKFHPHTLPRGREVLLLAPFYRYTERLGDLPKVLQEACTRASHVDPNLLRAPPVPFLSGFFHIPTSTHDARFPRDLMKQVNGNRRLEPYLTGTPINQE